MKYHSASAVLVVLGVWMAYTAVLDFQRADFVALCFAIGVSLGVFALAFTPQFLFERFSVAGMLEKSHPVSSASLVLSALGALAVVTGVLLKLWEFVR